MSQIGSINEGGAELPPKLDNTPSAQSAGAKAAGASQPQSPDRATEMGERADIQAHEDPIESVAAGRRAEGADPIRGPSSDVPFPPGEPGDI